jgi:hypothetical protein
VVRDLTAVRTSDGLNSTVYHLQMVRGNRAVRSETAAERNTEKIKRNRKMIVQHFDVCPMIK